MWDWTKHCLIINRLFIQRAEQIIADEIDMVINISALKNKDYEYIKEEIEEIRDAIDGKVLKVIIETCLLTKEEIVKMTEICNETFVNYRRKRLRPRII